MQLQSEVPRMRVHGPFVPDPQHSLAKLLPSERTLTLGPDQMARFPQVALRHNKDLVLDPRGGGFLLQSFFFFNHIKPVLSRAMPRRQPSSS